MKKKLSEKKAKQAQDRKRKDEEDLRHAQAMAKNTIKNVIAYNIADKLKSAGTFRRQTTKVVPSVLEGLMPK